MQRAKVGSKEHRDKISKKLKASWARKRAEAGIVKPFFTGKTGKLKIANPDVAGEINDGLDRLFAAKGLRTIKEHTQKNKMDKILKTLEEIKSLLADSIYQAKYAKIFETGEPFPIKLFKKCLPKWK